MTRKRCIVGITCFISRISNRIVLSWWIDNISLGIYDIPEITTQTKHFTQFIPVSFNLNLHRKKIIYEYKYIWVTFNIASSTCILYFMHVVIHSSNQFSFVFRLFVGVVIIHAMYRDSVALRLSRVFIL